jgi:methyl-accepting chemotaxis protein
MNLTKYFFTAVFLMVLGGLLVFLPDGPSYDRLKSMQMFVIFFGGFSPLVYYYYQLWHIQTKGRQGDSIQIHLTEIEIDSIYYLGFLITLSTLVISIGMNTLASIGNPLVVVGQFSLGLVATGFALWGRLDLQQRNQRLSDPDTIVDEYVSKMERVVYDVDTSYAKLQMVFNNASSNFERSSQLLENFSESLTRINIEMLGAADSLGTGLSAIHDKSDNIDEALDSLLVLSTNLKKVDGLVSDLAKSIKSLDKSGISDVVKSVENASEALNKSAKNFEKELSDSAKSISNKSTSFASDLNSSTLQLGNALTGLSSALVSVANKVADTLKR